MTQQRTTTKKTTAAIKQHQRTVATNKRPQNATQLRCPQNEIPHTTKAKDTESKREKCVQELYKNIRNEVEKSEECCKFHICRI